ncbi:MAG: PSD1 and planctomycete cytochrome C domain-containing protein [Candidatus Hinthialibacter antarcticus]|nr:PSD1 and planctomycete cytochrome C domain-containing protein [Candidatus Hinthialibacter antarcticus]
MMKLLLSVLAPFGILSALSLTALAGDPPTSLPEPAEGAFNFVQDIQPVFESRCVVCHGEKMQKGSFRLDRKADALTGGGTGRAIIPGDSANSPLVQMVAGVGDRPRMPIGGDPLSEEQVALLRAWIDQGAEWPDDGSSMSQQRSDANHWAFQPRTYPEIPTVKNSKWISRPIDAFVLAQLEDKGFSPSQPASRETLVRRLNLDLLGLLPSPEEIKAFVNDERPDAYERVVDRLLASPHFGERWGRHWLDLARYADSDGFEKDLPRPYAWVYRDWVIDAINADKPYDQFTIEQLAGDLLPEPTQDQIIATGFHRNTLTNREGGVDPEEYRIKAVKDRASTTSSVWLGLTMACAECHNHKYDPLTQKEFYGLFAFFNQADEKDIAAPKPAETQKYESDHAVFEVVHDRLQDALNAYDRNEFPRRFDDWMSRTSPPGEKWRTLNAVGVETRSGAAHDVLPDGSILIGGATTETDEYVLMFETPLRTVTAIELETLAHESLPQNGSGRADNGNFVLSELTASAKPLHSRQEEQTLSFVEVNADTEQEQWLAQHAVDGDEKTGWSPGGNTKISRRLALNIAEPIAHANGWQITVRIKQDYGTRHALGRFRVLASSSNGPLRTRPFSSDMLWAWQTDANERTPDQQAMLVDYYRGIDPVRKQLQKSIDEHKKNAPKKPNTMAMAMAPHEEGRASHIHIRGDFLRKGDEVNSHTPAVLPALQVTKQQPTRLDLARWMVSDENPLAARVAANRVWQYLFGEGIVATPEDFGTRGDPPSHPQLLDWLANRYIELGWSRKALIREIVTSSTYKQQSAIRDELVHVDAKNHLLARQNRYRLSAELVRDISLQTSGLLNRAVGGPSIRPPLPADVAALGYANSVKWTQSKGDEIYRRGLYIFFQRTVPYPMLMTFDCPDSNVTCIRRNRSNTPLQALTLLNDPVFWECAASFGKQIATEMKGDSLERIRMAFFNAIGREPNEQEAYRLGRLFNESYQMMLQSPEDAAVLLGDMELNGVRPAEAAAWVSVGRVLMNLEEYMTRQ